MTPAIYVRGAGVVGALGHGAEAVLAALSAPTSLSLSSPTPPSTPLRAGEPRTAPFRPADLPGGIGRRLGRQPALALAAVLDALGGRPAPGDAALVLATAHGAMSETIDFVGGAAVHGAAAASPLLFSNSLHNAMAGAVGRALDLRGPAIVVSNGAVSFESALVVAVAMLRTGHARHAIVGGSDASHPVFARGLRAVGLLAEVDAPADAATGRTSLGFPGAEGGGALLLEAGPPGGPGVLLDEPSLGASLRLPAGADVADDVARGDADVQWLTTGAERSVAAHRDAWRRLAVEFAAADPARAPCDATFPAERHGVFGSLSAVAIAVEAARRLRRAASRPRCSVFLNVPHLAPPAAVVLRGQGAG